MVTDFRAVSLKKAPSPIEVTEFGIVIEVRAVSSKKALPPIDVTELVGVNETEVRAVS